MTNNQLWRKIERELIELAKENDALNMYQDHDTGDQTCEIVGPVNLTLVAKALAERLEAHIVNMKVD